MCVGIILQSVHVYIGTAHCSFGNSQVLASTFGLGRGCFAAFGGCW